jgi:hypothetical protein
MFPLLFGIFISIVVFLVLLFLASYGIQKINEIRNRDIVELIQHSFSYYETNEIVPEHIERVVDKWTVYDKTMYEYNETIPEYTKVTKHRAYDIEIIESILKPIKSNTRKKRILMDCFYCCTPYNLPRDIQDLFNKKDSRSQ